MIIQLEEIDSTNSYLRQMLSSQIIEEGTIVSTKYQVAGRGQRGNSWESEHGKNLIFSMVLYPNFVAITQQFILSQTIALAIKEVLDKYTSDISIKWPNDIHWKDEKIGGLLIEASLSSDKIENIIVGIGLNINQETFSSDAPNPVSLKQITKQDHNLDVILSDIRSNILSYYQNLKLGRDTAIAEQYKEQLFRNKGYHSYFDGKIIFEAKIKGILSTGHLVLQTKEGNVRTFAFKEVAYI